MLGLLTGDIKSERCELWERSTEIELKAFEISSCLKQAAEYYKAAGMVTLETEPLLQFYGAQALAKAAILASKREISLSSINYHGLTQRASTAPKNADALREYSSNSLNWAVEKEFAISNDGVFPLLAETAGDPIPSNGTVYTTQEMIRLIPDLSDQYQRHYNESSHCIEIYSGPETTADGKLANFFNSAKDLADVLAIFPDFNEGYNKAKIHSVFPGFQSTNPLDEIPQFYAIEYGTTRGEYLVKPHSSGIHSSLPVYYILLYIISNLVRYKPAFWMEVVSGQSTASAAILEFFCDSALLRFPKEVLEKIWNEKFTFGSPAYAA